MSKRDHDTEIWLEDWFLELSDSEMLFWFYIKDRCDHAGFWRPNFKMFENSTGRRIHRMEFLKKINTGKERIKTLDNGRWFLTGFISFQYCGKLNLNNRFHKSVWGTFRKNIPYDESTCYGFEVSLTSIRPQVEVNKIQDTKNEEEKKKKGVGRKGKTEFIPPSFEVFEKYCEENNHKNIAQRTYTGYKEADWHDSKGKPIKNWKQKLQHVWFKEDNKDNKQSDYRNQKSQNEYKETRKIPIIKVDE